MSLILSGNSGSLTVDSTAGITFPNGSNPQAAPSKVLQVVSATLNNATQTTSTSFTSTGLTASITPLFSTSKILILINSIILTQSSSYPGYATIYRNSTNLGTNTGFAFVSVGSSADIPISMTYLDSPATTSSTSYTVYIKSSNSSGYVQLGDSGGGIYQTSVITLMEIAQ